MNETFRFFVENSRSVWFRVESPKFSLILSNFNIYLIFTPFYKNNNQCSSRNETKLVIFRDVRDVRDDAFSGYEP